LQQNSNGSGGGGDSSSSSSSSSSGGGGDCSSLKTVTHAINKSKNTRIWDLIKGLKNKTSVRLDGFSSSLTRKCYTYLIKTLTFLTN
jgi:hypothetical protein